MKLNSNKHKGRCGQTVFNLCTNLHFWGRPFSPSFLYIRGYREPILVMTVRNCTKYYWCNSISRTAVLML